MTNILINRDGLVKIIDFGFSCPAFEKLRMYCGTPSYMAPEMVMKRSYRGMPMDIWALAVVLFKLLTGEYAFGGKSTQ
jgi:serine/threonine protein kinase